MSETMIVKKACPVCGKQSEVEVDCEQHKKWRDGALIQNAFPAMSEGEREILKTGICDKCWKDIFA